MFLVGCYGSGTRETVTSSSHGPTFRSSTTEEQSLVLKRTKDEDHICLPYTTNPSTHGDVFPCLFCLVCVSEPFAFLSFPVPVYH